MAKPTTAFVRHGSGDPVLLLHPFAMSHHVWSAVIEELSDSYDVAAVSLPGHWGGPRLGWWQVSIAAYADGIERWMDEAGWATCHIVGNSLGAWVAFELEHRGRARSVLAIAPAGGWHSLSYPELLIGTKFLALFPAVVVGRLLGELAPRLRLVRNLALRLIASDVAAVRTEDAKNYIRAATHCGAYLAMQWAGLCDGGIRHLGDVRAPTQLVFCGDDKLLPARLYAGRFVEELADGDSAITLDGVGHVPMLEDPRRVTEVIRTHLGAA